MGFWIAEFPRFIVMTMVVIGICGVLGAFFYNFIKEIVVDE